MHVELPFVEFASIPRLSRNMVVTEKLDGTNAQVYIEERALIPAVVPSTMYLEVGNYLMVAGSRSRWISRDADNYGFAAWVYEHCEELVHLGPGHHFGEWWGSGIQRGYGLTNGEKRFSLFNVGRWLVAGQQPSDPKQEYAPTCCSVVPILYTGPFNTGVVDALLAELRENGSRAAPGFMRPEGVVVWHEAGRVLFKKTLEKNDGHKGA